MGRARKRPASSFQLNMDDHAMDDEQRMEDTREYWETLGYMHGKNAAEPEVVGRVDVPDHLVGAYMRGLSNGLERRDSTLN